jgi:hypothetical protein
VLKTVNQLSKWTAEVVPVSQFTPEVKEPTKVVEVEWTQVSSRKKSREAEKKVEIAKEVKKTLVTSYRPDVHTGTNNCTAMCRSVMEGTKCPHGSRCRFAHKVSQLVRRECAFGCDCRLTKKVAEGVYMSIPSRSGKVCQFWHAKETSESYGKRLGIIK